MIANADFIYDEDGTLRKWREKLEEKESREIVKGTRVLKKAGQITDLKAIFISDMKEVQNGIKKGWFNIFKQGRNSNGKPREPKYMVKIFDVPPEFITKLKE